ncbi:hypothetical protein WICPIJ_001826 [Wickerhamomyces pijperi]|uniref:Uncharacterized protein n=1 Tax=Wickerhamomyces pijperi TaxID=599730 RepID=A0A9P8TQ81_WICPI|nr:hypothetical protein WICPIJ_001826 [Wickerhamomyces pijperi]
MPFIKPLLKKAAVSMYSVTSAQQNTQYEDDYIQPLNESFLQEEGCLASIVQSKRCHSTIQASFKRDGSVDVCGSGEKIRPMMSHLSTTTRSNPEIQTPESVYNIHQEDHLECKRELSRDDFSMRSFYNSIATSIITIVPALATSSISSMISRSFVQPSSFFANLEDHRIDSNETNDSRGTSEGSFIDQEGIQLMMKVYSYLSRKISLNKELVIKFLNFLVFLNLLMLNILKFCLGYLEDVSSPASEIQPKYHQN